LARITEEIQKRSGVAIAHKVLENSISVTISGRKRLCDGRPKVWKPKRNIHRKMLLMHPPYKLVIDDSCLPGVCGGWTNKRALAEIAKGIVACGVRVIDHQKQNSLEKAFLTLQCPDPNILQQVVQIYQNAWQHATGSTVSQDTRIKDREAKGIQQSIASSIWFDLVSSSLGRKMKAASNAHCRLIVPRSLLPANLFGMASRNNSIR
jgi:hypothetical protein